MSSKTVAIIGAGPSGLVSAKVALESGLLPRVFESSQEIGGIWSHSSKICRRSMRTNISKYSCCFSDFPWPPDTPMFPTAAQVGEYLCAYTQRYLRPEVISLGCRVTSVECFGTENRWSITWTSTGGQQTAVFDHLIVSCGFSSEPYIPPVPGVNTFPGTVVHSSSLSSYQDYAGKHVAIIGGSFSSVEVADEIAPRAASVHHVVPRPFWVLPRYLPLNVEDPGTTFLPLDLVLYRRSRLTELSTQQRWRKGNEYLKSVCGDLSGFSDAFKVDMDMPPYTVISDTYANFVRSGRIIPYAGHLGSISDSKLELDSKTTPRLPPGITHIIFATGFSPSSTASILPPSLLSALNHSPTDRFLPFTLDRSALHPALSNAGFVGNYRGSFWGVIELHARWCAGLFSGSIPWPPPGEMQEGVAFEENMRHSKFCKQFPRDYVHFGSALTRVTGTGLPPETVGGAEDIFVPQHFISPLWVQRRSTRPGTPNERDGFNSLTRTLSRSANSALFVAAAVFRSLHGTWLIDRTYESRSSDHPSGCGTGNAEFTLRNYRSTSLKEEGCNVEYLYSEKTDMTTSTGLKLSGTRQYIYRYDEVRDRLEVFFVERNEDFSLGGPFHEIELTIPPVEGGNSASQSKMLPWKAKGSHFCSPDAYEMTYTFHFKGADLVEWKIEYDVKGPRKDYSITTLYTRAY